MKENTNLVSFRPSRLRRAARSLAAAASILGWGAFSAGAEEPLAAARAAVEASQFEAAKATLESYLESNASDAEALHLLGRAESGLGNHKTGEEKILAAIQLDGTRAQFYADLGSVMIARAQTMDPFSAGPIFMAAVDKFRQAVQIDPDNLHGRIGLCRYYWNAPEMGGGSIKKAKDEAAHVERLNPYLGKTEFALIAQKEGRDADAIRLFNELEAMNPGQAWIHFELGKLYQITGQPAEARAAYEKTLSLQPDHAGAKGALAGLPH